MHPSQDGGLSLRASEVAELVGGRFHGDADPKLSAVVPLDRAGPGDLGLLARPSYLAYVERARAGAVLVTDELAGRIRAPVPRIVVADVHRALAEVLPRLYPEAAPEPGVHATACIGAEARWGDDVSIGPYAVLGRDVRLGDRVRVGPHTVVHDGCELGDDVTLHSQATLYRGVRVGARTVVHSGVRAGVEGFGYARTDGGNRKIPQVGGCIIGEDVDIGANTTIDRGSIGTTEIGDGVKIDNLVHIGHNVHVGEQSIIVAQVGVSGSVTLGRQVTLAGQAGISGHLEIGDGATVAAQAGVIGDVPAGATYSGYPARPHKEAMRAHARLFRLPRLMKRVRAIEQALFGRDVPDE